MSRRRSYSVLVVEDEALIRENLVKKIREQCPEFEVIGQAANGQEALEAVAELYPDVLITDIRMPVLDGLGLLREVYFNFPDIKAVIVSGFDEFTYAQSAIQYGVKDYLLKPVSPAELKAALARLQVLLDAEQDRFADEHLDFPAAPAQEQLVSMVQEYLRSHFAEELSITQLAERFHVSPPYLTRLFKRQIGSAPVRYLRDLRLHYARKLLEERPELEIKEIGAIAGYPDPGYFSRVFKSATGMSPLEFRETHQRKV